MAPSSPSSARASTRKRPARDDEIHDEAEEVAASSAKRRRTRKQAKAAKAGRRNKGEVEVERNKEPVEDDVCAEEPDEEEMAMGEEEEEEAEAEAQAGPEEQQASPEKAGRKRVAQPNRNRNSSAAAGGVEHEPEFLGEPVPSAEARSKWPKRYDRNAAARRPEEDDDVKARCHYRSARVDSVVYSLNDDVYVKAGENEADYIGRITEFFEGTDRCCYFTCRWFFRPEDTVINALVSISVDGHKHDPKRVFLSEDKNDNVLDCIISKVKIVHVDPNMDQKAKAQLIEHCDLYYDMSYSVAYSTFANISSDNDASGSETASGISSDDVETSSATLGRTATLLDLYSGCGGMSTGLCLGSVLAGLKLETRWAVDLNSYACESLKYNHPQTEVRNEKADEFLALLREWTVLCDKYVHEDVGSDLAGSEDQEDEGSPLDRDEFVVEKLIGICYGGSGRKKGLYFKVQWEGYGPEEDTWEPIDNLSDCPLKIREFVQEGYRKRILPQPGDVDVICGGPPCQGISGFNRFRNRDDPLKDEKNKQMVTFMDIVAYLKPKYVLMENVVDILKFADGYLGRYALSCLVAMNYQARLGMMVAGCYGLPQFRNRVFLWGALSSVVLPKYPLPTHDVVVRGGAPNAFSQSVVAYDETKNPSLKKALLLGDAISDLPKASVFSSHTFLNLYMQSYPSLQVENHQPNDVMEYSASPKTEFQHYIRLGRKDMLDYSFGGEAGPDEGKLLDHQPLRLNNDDHQRVQQIPVKKGANFRDLKGVKVGANNIVEWDPEIERVHLPSGKPLVPDYAMSFIKGRSLKPFGRLWWDETVPTVVTRAEPHNQIILHPDQARVLTVRENARLQGFPDYYRLFGPIKEKYIQVGNAVAVPVARALGYCLGQAYLGESDGSDPLYVLPDSFTAVGQPVAPARVGTPAGEVVEQ
ncbi:DNA (cytosine-5)-methyltransferase 3-like [Phragmites australis]|uniref:DNA (cytosine-5)-methyltransferase 3-like n=1 Tax=Phragmites australis TaxID=29695 RepID=UPI002D793D90|nr:DNA (cytosine-5)-methyltransferase 3-like [Phragmites australis]